MNRALLAIVATAAGFLLLITGVTVIYWPAGLILAGVLLMAAGLFAVDLG